MKPTSRPARPLSWATRRELRRGPQGSLQIVQRLQLQHDPHRQLWPQQRPHLDWSHVALPDLFYTHKQIQQLYHDDIKRLDSVLGRLPSVTTRKQAWAHEAQPPPVTTSSPFEGRLEGQPPPRPLWPTWSSLASGWAAGALLLLAALLLVRFIDRCLTRKLLEMRRRDAEEWQTPTVLATSNQYPLDGDSESFPRASDSDGSSSETSRDLPPPYSECAEPEPQTPLNKEVITHDEPPPPYSACYVAFSDPKDETPSVHFYNEQGQSLTNDAHSRNRFNEQINSERRNVENGKPDANVVNGNNFEVVNETNSNNVDRVSHKTHSASNRASGSTSMASDGIDTNYIVDISNTNKSPEKLW